jgi:hypothetical protein
MTFGVYAHIPGEEISPTKNQRLLLYLIHPISFTEEGGGAGVSIPRLTPFGH